MTDENDRNAEDSSMPNIPPAELYLYREASIRLWLEDVLCCEDLSWVEGSQGEEQSENSKSKEAKKTKTLHEQLEVCCRVSMIRNAMSRTNSIELIKL